MRHLGSLTPLVFLLLPISCSDEEQGPRQDGFFFAEGGTCSPATCGGCCSAAGACIVVVTNTSCGMNGIPCKTCQSDQVCQLGQCVTASTKCNPRACPSGCCANDQCVKGTAGNACGKGGLPCSTCASTQTCQNQACLCTTSSCTGCCALNVCKTGTESSACGKGGVACKQCKAGEYCVSGSCSTSSGCTGCTGCCDGTTCKQGTDVSACGTGGAACKKCQTGESCVSGVCNNPQTCGPSSCPGCCSSGQCLAGSASNACGTGGAVCAACKSNQTCTSGTCKLNSTSSWSITVTSASIDTSKKWDWPLYPSPDPYAEITVGSDSGKTTVKGDTYTPAWNELVLTTTAGALISYGMKVAVYDDDGFLGMGDDIIGQCTVTIKESNLLAGGGTVSTCGGTDLQSIGFKFTSN